MRTIERPDKPNGMHFCYDHWHYCEWCGKCHSESDTSCRQDGDDTRKGSCRQIKMHDADECKSKRKNWMHDVDGREWYCKNRMHDIGNRYGRYEPDDEYGRRYESRYGQDDRRDCRERHVDEEYEGGEERDSKRSRMGCKPEKQKHVHEFQGSVKLAEFDEDVHNHRFAGVSGEAIKVPGGHIHKILTRTDFFDHFHFIDRFTGLAIPVDIDREGGKKVVEKHTHFVEGITSENDGHMHQFEVATLIESPLLPEEDEDIR